MDKSKIELSILIQYFEVHDRTEGKPPRTVEWYNQALGMFTIGCSGRDWQQA